MKRLGMLICALVLGITMHTVYAEETETKAENGVAAASEDEKSQEGIIKLTLKKIYGFEGERKSGIVPFVYYLNEAGPMAGMFYYNSDTFKMGGETTVTTMYSPTTDIATLWLQSKNFKAGKHWKFGTTMRLIKYNDIRNYWPGNDSPSNAADEAEIAKFKQNYYLVSTGALPPSVLDEQRSEKSDELRGYKKYEGFNNMGNIRVSYMLNENHELYLEPQYEVLKTQVNRYQSDTVTAAYKINKKDSDSAPHEGYQAEFKIKKSLNMLSKDEENSWDYYKLIFDGRKYIPITKRSTLALRFKTESTGGKKVVDKERSLIAGEEIYSYAPFFDMAILGDLEIMRGSYMNRYWGKHSVLFQGEYRFPLFKKEGVQGVIFTDIGRVSNNYGTELLKYLQINGGAGIRYFFNKDIMLRMDIGTSKEGMQMRANLGHAF